MFGGGLSPAASRSEGGTLEYTNLPGEYLGVKIAPSGAPESYFQYHTHPLNREHMVSPYGMLIQIFLL